VNRKTTLNAYERREEVVKNVCSFILGLCNAAFNYLYYTMTIVSSE
jgi:hypothetical protein